MNRNSSKNWSKKKTNVNLNIGTAYYYHLQFCTLYFEISMHKGICKSYFYTVT